MLPVYTPLVEVPACAGAGTAWGLPLLARAAPTTAPCAGVSDPRPPADAPSVLPAPCAVVPASGFGVSAAGSPAALPTAFTTETGAPVSAATELYMCSSSAEVAPAAKLPPDSAELVPRTSPLAIVFASPLSSPRSVAMPAISGTNAAPAAPVSAPLRKSPPVSAEMPPLTAPCARALLMVVLSPVADPIPADSPGANAPASGPAAIAIRGAASSYHLESCSKLTPVNFPASSYP